MQEIINQTVDFVKQQLEGDSSGHDWWHVYRVWKLAESIAQKEINSNSLVIQLAALLHDVGDPKFFDGDTTMAPKLIGDFLRTLNISEEDKLHILHITTNLSFSKHLAGKEVEKSIEFQIVQDADRLDAIGAVGIARTFAFGGSRGSSMYDPNIKPHKKLDAKEYHKAQDPTINHFYEKLLLLKDLMNTDTAKMMAEQRHQFMETYLERFYQEWEGKK